MPVSVHTPSGHVTRSVAASTDGSAEVCTVTGYGSHALSGFGRSCTAAPSFSAMASRCWSVST